MTQADNLATETYATYVGKTGDISLPDNFRQQWTHLGSWVVNDAKAPGYGFHDVYTQLEALHTFQKTGKFPDGTVLVKEIRKIGSGKLTTGEALWATDNAIWFVMVKDNKGRFKGNPNWGEGWGWALFEAKNRNTNVSKGYVQSCIGCHTPAKQTDWVFVQGYPTLSAK
jgi:cytochrome c